MKIKVRIGARIVNYWGSPIIQDIHGNEVATADNYNHIKVRLDVKDYPIKPYSYGKIHSGPDAGIYTDVGFSATVEVDGMVFERKLGEFLDVVYLDPEDVINED